MMPDPTIDEAVGYLSDHLDPVPDLAIVLGSGLGNVVDAIDRPSTAPYATIPGFADVTVAGHEGRLVCGEFAGTRVVALQGRFHLYEGHSPAAVVLPVRALARLGIGTLIVTNSAGALDPRWRAGDLMLIDDHINLMFTSPLTDAVVPGEQRFPDMSRPYDEALLELAARVALRERIPVRRGVYCAVRGPNYETPAEIRMVKSFGAHAIGMSTVPEVIAARASGMRVLGVSILSNLAAGLVPTGLSHKDVLAAGRQAAEPLARLLAGVVTEAFA